MSEDTKTVGYVLSAVQKYLPGEWDSLSFSTQAVVPIKGIPTSLYQLNAAAIRGIKDRTIRIVVISLIDGTILNEGDLN
jgi:hypothetical protein